MAERRLWGHIGDAEIYLFTVRSGSMELTVSNYGGVLQSLKVRDGSGALRDVVLGYDTLEEYRNDETYFGAAVGPIADRIKGGRFIADGHEFVLTKNCDGDTMHSGAAGFDHAIWDAEPIEDGVRLTGCFEFGETLIGAGKLKATYTYRIVNGDTLSIEVSGVPERPMPLSITNHSYFNLSGGTESCLDALLSVSASRYAITDDGPCGTGEYGDVAGTPFDLREPVYLRDVVCHSGFDEIRKAGGGVDNFFIVDGEGFRRHASLEYGGLRMVCYSDAQGLLVYTGNGLRAEPGKSGAVYGQYWACCFETQLFPNGVNIPKEQRLFDRTHPYTARAEYRFEVIG